MLLKNTGDCRILMICRRDLRYYTSQDPATGPVSPTAAMPAFLGAIFAICAVAARFERSRSRRKARHARGGRYWRCSQGAIGSLYPVVKTVMKGDDLVVA